MKQTIKDYLRLMLGLTTTFIIICSCVLPIIYVNNIFFTILYLIILWPLIVLGIYKITIKSYNIINEL